MWGSTTAPACPPELPPSHLHPWAGGAMPVWRSGALGTAPAGFACASPVLRLCKSLQLQGLGGCSAVCPMVLRSWEAAGKSSLQPLRALLVLFKHRNLAAPFFSLFSLVSKMMELIFLHLAVRELTFTARPLSHQRRRAACSSPHSSRALLGSSLPLLLGILHP